MYAIRSYYGCQFRRLFLHPLARAVGDVVAEGLFGHVVAVHRIGPGTAASADIDELALAALALVLFEIAQIVEHLGVEPKFLKRNLLDVADGRMEVV